MEKPLFKKKLFNLINENIFKSYLRFLALNNTKISDNAAILLYKNYNEKNLYLIARPLIARTHFFMKIMKKEKRF